MRRLCFTILLFIGVVACDDSYKSSIPNVRDFVLRYNVDNFPKIKTPGYFVKIEKNEHGLPIGYAGVILGKPLAFTVFGDNNYVAFDAACPVEVSSKVSVELQDDGFGIAICPSCGTKYDCSSGAPTEGEGKESLKRYNVIASGNILQVSN
ncbi:hypothetical protein [Bacteroides sp.]